MYECLDFQSDDLFGLRWMRFPPKTSRMRAVGWS